MATAVFQICWHIVCSTLTASSFRMISSNGMIFFFSQLNNICIIYIHTYMTFSLSIHLLRDTCFHVLATVNTIAMNMGMQISFWNSEFTVFRKLPRSGIITSYDSSLHNFFEGPPILFSIIVVPIYIPTNMHKGSLFSTFLSTPHTSHSNRYEVISLEFFILS